MGAPTRGSFSVCSWYDLPVLSYEDLKAIAEQRRSIRYFTGEPITGETIRQLMDVANLSPSVENTQPWHFHVILNEDMRARLMETCCYGNFVLGAAAFIVVTCDRTAQPKSQELIWNPKELEYSCVVAMSYLMLAATALELGSCWVSLHHGKAHDVLKPQDNHMIVGAVMIGHLKPSERKAKGKAERNAVESIFTIYE